MKPLSKKRIKELEFWMIIIALTMMISIIVCHTIITNEVNFESASPCELGLMEWETKIEYTDDFEVIRRLPYYTPNYGCERFAHHRCELWYYESEKSCPYSGPGIMVEVKE